MFFIAILDFIKKRKNFYRSIEDVTFVYPQKSFSNDNTWVGLLRKNCTSLINAVNEWENGKKNTKSESKQYLYPIRAAAEDINGLLNTEFLYCSRNRDSLVGHLKVFSEHLKKAGTAKFKKTTFNAVLEYEPTQEKFLELSRQCNNLLNNIKLCFKFLSGGSLSPKEKTKQFNSGNQSPKKESPVPSSTERSEISKRWFEYWSLRAKTVNSYNKVRECYINVLLGFGVELGRGEGLDFRKALPSVPTSVPSSRELLLNVYKCLNGAKSLGFYNCDALLTAAGKAYGAERELKGKKVHISKLAGIFKQSWREGGDSLKIADELACKNEKYYAHLTVILKGQIEKLTDRCQHLDEFFSALSTISQK